MQKVASESKWLRGILVAALYVSVYGCATAQVDTTKLVTPTSAVSLPASAVVGAGAVASMPVSASGVGATVPDDVVEHHIALILPLKSAAYGKAAEIIQQGFMVGAEAQANGLPVRVYPCDDEKSEAVAAYQKAIKLGAVAVAGPLTRNGVAALAANPDLPVPTLALNVIDTTRADQLYFFGLPGEVEARQSADLATAAGLLSATIVRTDSVLSKRLAVAFTESWKRSGGVVNAEIIYAGDSKVLSKIPTEQGNMVFLAAELDKARALRPFISNLLPIYATSQVFAGNENNMVNFDLSEVRFMDMPWVLQPDHPAVMVYPHVTPPLSLDRERLYALGIDAYRLLQVFYQHDTINSIPLDGVTGKINLYGHTLERQGTPAVLRAGQAMLLVETKAE
ncbi:MAG: penicillin-binding protein activator [Sideroxydans sp.]|nr:penicillin-binding protein activator [Sideroxydans sp.]